MSDPIWKISNRKRRRAILISVSLLSVLAAGGLALGIIEKVRDASDRAT